MEPTFNKHLDSRSQGVHLSRSLDIFVLLSTPRHERLPGDVPELSPNIVGKLPPPSILTSHERHCILATTIVEVDEVPERSAACHPEDDAHRVSGEPPSTSSMLR